MSSEKTLQLIPRDIDEIRIGIAGAGKMGNFYLAALRQLTNGQYEDYYKGGAAEQLKKIRICGLYDCDRTRLEGYTNITCYESLKPFIVEQRPHILIIATPICTHMKLAKESLESGIHTFVEKPLVTHLWELNELIAIGERNGCRLMSGHVERYNPVAIKIVSLLNDKSFKVNSYSFVRIQKHDERIADDIIADKLIHDIDLASYFWGSIEKITVNETREVNGQPYEIRLEAIHENNVRGDIFASWLVRGDEKKREVRIFSENITLLGDFAGKRLLVNGEPINCEVPGMIKPFNNQIKDELVDFIIYCSRPEASGRRIAPLLTLGEIVQSVSLLDTIAAKVILRRYMNG